MIQAFIRTICDFDEDEAVMKYVVDRPVAGAIIKIGNNKYIVDRTNLTMIDNKNDQPYRRGIEKHVTVKIRRGTTLHEINSNLMPLETSDFVIALGDESMKEIGHINEEGILSDQEKADITLGFMVGDLILDEEGREKIIVDFDRSVGVMCVIAISARSKSQNPSRSRHPIVKIKKVEVEND